jgi:hypothetical protein
MMSGLFCRPDPVWVARSKSAYWLSKLRTTISWAFFPALMSWDIFYVFLSSGSRQEVGRVICMNGWRLSFLFPHAFSDLYNNQCSAGGGEPTLSLVILCAKMAIAAVSGGISLFLFAILLVSQPPARMLNAFVDRERHNKNFVWKVLAVLGIYFVALPLMPIALILTLLNQPHLFKASFHTEFVCSAAAFLLYFFIATALYAAEAARLVLRGRSYLDLPPAT